MKLTQYFTALVLLATQVASIPTLLRVDNAPEYTFQLETPEDFDLNLQELRLVQMAPDAEPIWITELEKIQAMAAGLNFMDITEAEDLGTHSLKKHQWPEFHGLSASKEVKQVIKELSIDGPVENLQAFTSFRTRHYRSQSGRESQKWLAQRIHETTSKFAAKGLQNLITISEFPHSWGQNSIVVRINGSSPTDEGIVVVGAHQDSTNIWPFLPAPGADDDGSGSVTILEAYRALIASDFRPVQHVEFHWYSAEEGGLLGSQAVAKDYAAKEANVVAMSQFDMTAWVKSGHKEEVGIIVDYVDPEVTALNKHLVDAYLDIPYVETKCGYACSDHASWSKAGYRSSFTIESAFENSNKNIHSANDRIDISPEFSFTHMLEFSKLAVAFVIEVGGWAKK
ncbi:peptidase [Multifurca ochricompacta]|uniref:Peptide hydrolase n=1 Tax=Multifurca ochricompacta TaxID=376703 RepID=A0AAD4LZ18_9AGAM|nr:peptidase [Multifurca ochricompacta]